MTTQLTVTLASAAVGLCSAVAVALIGGYFARAGKGLDRDTAHEASLASMENALRGDLLRRMQTLEERDKEKTDRLDQSLDAIRGLKDELAGAHREIRTLSNELAAARERITALLTELARVQPRPQES